jgi:ubiquitin-protein ligase
MADTPAGMKINFDEQNMTEWEIQLDGPEQSIYAVRIHHAPQSAQIKTRAF